MGNSFNGKYDGHGVYTGSGYCASYRPSGNRENYQQLKALWELPAYQFYLGGVERISAIVLQICLSVLVYKAVKTENKKFWAAYIGYYSQSKLV